MHLALVNLLLLYSWRSICCTGCFVKMCLLRTLVLIDCPICYLTNFPLSSGYSLRTGSASPRRQKLDTFRDEPDFGNFVRPHFGRGFRGGRGGRFRDVSPNHRHGRGGRPLGRGYGVSGRGAQPFHGEYIHRNDPNLSPREGDWICQNPS